MGLFPIKAGGRAPAVSGRMLLLLLLLPVLWQMYKYMIVYTVGMFSEPLESMSHGWLIPLVSLYALWLQREPLRRAAAAPSLTGLLCVALSLTVYWFGSRGGQSRIEQVSLIGLLWALPFAFWGAGVARLLIFPVGYLVFTIPLSSFLDFFTVTLRLLSTSIVCGFMNGIGYEIQRVGNALYSRMPDAPFMLDVADGCSGIESFFAVMALTAAYAWLRQKTLLQKGLLFMFAVPIAVIGNSLRLVGDCLVATWFGQQAVGGYYHDYSGFAVAILNVFLVILAGQWVARLDGRVEGLRFLPRFLRETRDAPEAAAGRRPRGAAGVPAFAAVLVVTLCVARSFIPEASYGEAAFVARQLPVRVLEFSGVVPMFCHNDLCLAAESEERLQAIAGDGALKCPACGAPMFYKALAETTDMPADTVILKRNYRSSDGMTYDMNVVIGGRSRYSIHRAEQCLPSQGFLMERTGTLALQIPGFGELSVRRIDASRQGVSGATLLYWFVSEARVCSSHFERILLDVWDRSVHNRINRWVMFSVFLRSGLGSDESVARLEEFLAEWYPQVYLRESGE